MAPLLLFLLGLALGSFVNALVWRLHEQAKNKKDRSISITRGRSMCPNCRHELSAKDLVPLFSWLWLRGRCRYCGKPISAQYPLVELATALVFVASYVFWPNNINNSGEYVLFIAWLASSVGLMALFVYDLRWMLLPSRIIYPTLAIVLTGRLGYILLYSDQIARDLVLIGGSLLVASGFFWLLFYVSKGKWIGYGDVRLGLITGTILAHPAKSGLMIFTASVLGLIYSLPQILLGKTKMSTQVPFGPFLIAGTFIALLFGDAMLDFYKNALGL